MNLTPLKNGASLLVIGVLLLSSFIVYLPHKASAIAAGNGCASSMNTWDWPAWTAKSSPRSGSVTGGGVPGFDAANFSYLVVGIAHSATYSWLSSLYMFTATTPQDKLVLYEDSSGNEHVKSIQNGTVYVETINDDSNLSNHTVNFVPSLYAYSSGTDYQITGSAAYNPVGASPICVEFTKNVLYDTSFTDPKYTNGPGWTSGVGGPSSGPSCSGITDVVCYMSNLFSSVGNSIANAFQAFGVGLYSLFVPSGQQLSADWNAFSSTMQTKLGFLLWPFSFVTSLFSATLSPTTPCCTIGAGTFMHASWPGINLKYASIALPTLWSFLTDMIKGLSILILLFALRRKFLEITHK